MTMVTVPTVPNVGMQDSRWMVESTAHLADQRGFSLAVHSAAVGMTESFTERDAAELLSWDTFKAFISEREGTTPRTRRNDPRMEARLQIEVRLGLEMTHGFQHVAGFPGDPENLYLTKRQLSSWLFALDVPDPSKTADAVLQLELPTLGSPPEDWKTVASLFGRAAPSPYLVAAGLAAWGDRPVMALLCGATGFVIFFSAPAATTIRDHYTERLQARLEQDDGLPPRRPRET